MVLPDSLERRAHIWIDAWNSRDLDCILALYTDQCEMSSPEITQLGHSPAGVLVGKDRLRRYWRDALALLPGLHFKLRSVFVSPESAIIRYRDDRNHDVCEYLQYDQNGLIIRAAAHHLAVRD